MIVDKTKNTVRNSKWGFFNKFLSSMLPFVSRTIIIKTLGTDYVGLSGLFTSVLTILNLSELGISSAIVFSMYKPIAEDDQETICALLKFYKRIYIVIGIIMLIAGIFCTPFLPILIRGEVKADVNLYILFIMYLLNTVLSYLLFAYRNSLFAAHQRNDITHKIQMIIVVFQYAAQIVVLLYWRNYYFYVLVLLFATVLNNFLIYIWSKKEYPQYVCRGNIDAKMRRNIKKQIGGLMLGKINVTVRTMLDNVFVSAFLGLTAVTIYTNYFSIVQAITSFITVISDAMVAGVGNSLVVNSVEENYRLFNRLTFMSQWLVGWCAICVLCLIQPFMELWMGKDLMFSDKMPFVCGLYIFVANIGMIRGVYTEALGIWWKIKWYCIVDIVLNLVSNFIFVKFGGAYGIILATVVNLAFFAIPTMSYILYKSYFGKEFYFGYIFSLIKYTFVAAAVGVATYIICSFITTGSLLVNLIFRFFVCAALPNFFFFLVYRKNKFFDETIAFMKEIVHVKNKF